MKKNCFKKYPFLSKLLVLLLTTSTACGPLGRNHGSVSHVKDDEDPDDDAREDQRREIDEKISEALHEIREMTEVTTDPDLDSMPYLYMEKNLDVETLDDNDGFKSNGGGADKSLHAPGAPISSSPEEDDKVNWRGRDEVKNMLKELDTRIKGFKSSNAGNASAGDDARSRYSLGTPSTKLVSYPFKTPAVSENGQRLAQALQYKSVVTGLVRPTDDNASDKLKLLELAGHALEISDEKLNTGEQGIGQFNLILANKVIDAVAAGANPSQQNGITYLALTGTDLATNQPASESVQAGALIFMSESICAEAAVLTGAAITTAAGVALIALAVNSVQTIIKDLALLKNDIAAIAEAIADENEKDPSTPTGVRGESNKVKPGTNAPAKIGGREYSGHALDRMQERGFTPAVVEDAIVNGTSMPGKKPGTVDHYSPNVTKVVTTAKGRVVTVY